MTPVEIEIDGPCNEELRFRPLQRNVRGRFDLMRINEPMAKVKSGEWTPIPSQRLGIDGDGFGYIEEALHDEQHAPLKEKIEKKGMTLEPPLQTFDGIDVPSWLFYMKRAVEAGIAHVTKGKLPDVVDAKAVKRNYLMADTEPSSTDKMAEAMQAQAKSFDRLTDAILRLVESK
ncbi:MAG: hypothetical protein KDA52_08085 [Planctomycetaceae bacterium]|nr:hypothetical protein [Planctomycetaceae bacterium]